MLQNVKRAFETVRIDKNIPLPVQKRETDAGYDLYALEDRWIWPFTTRKLLSNHKIDIDRAVGLIQSRSGFREKGLLIDGVIDEGYQGTWGIIASNVSLIPRKIKSGDRVCQVIYFDPLKIEHVEVEYFTRKTDRGIKGFNSSGTR